MNEKKQQSYQLEFKTINLYELIDNYVQHIIDNIADFLVFFNINMIHSKHTSIHSFTTLTLSILK